MILKRDQRLEATAEHCVVATFGPGAEVEEISLSEHKVDWDQDGFRGYVTNVALRSGLELAVSEARAEKFTRVPMDGGPTDLIFVLSRGTGLTVTVGNSEPYRTGAGIVEVSQVKRPVDMVSEFAAGAYNEFVVLKLTHELMGHLLAVEQLPDLIQAVVTSEESFARAVVPMGVAHFRLLDELLQCAEEGATRQLYLEGKALEVLARVFEAFKANSTRERAVLPARDVARLQEVRKSLLKSIDTLPSLEQLARDAGTNQTKLKEDFRTLFGLPIYSYLREQRLTKAHKLLGDGELNVTEVATRVGYSNTSKFASAFRKRFGVAPSTVRTSLTLQSLENLG